LVHEPPDSVACENAQGLLPHNTKAEVLEIGYRGLETTERGLGKDGRPIVLNIVRGTLGLNRRFRSGKLPEAAQGHLLRSERHPTEEIRALFNTIALSNIPQESELERSVTACSLRLR
jgi:hypothetical protein